MADDVETHTNRAAGSSTAGEAGKATGNPPNTQTLLYFAMTVTALAAVLEFTKVFVKHTPLEKIMLGTASHTCVAVLMILAIFETLRQKQTVIGKFTTRFGLDETQAKRLLYAIIFMVVLAMGIMAASEYHNQSNSEQGGSEISRALAAGVVAIIGIALVGGGVMAYRKHKS